MAFNVISFYRYATLDSLETLREQLRVECEKNNILGRILIAEEGINGAVCGANGHIESFKMFLQKNFPLLTFRERAFDKQAYHKLVVRVRPEIVAFGVSADLNNRGEHLPPEKLKEWLDNNEDFVLFDTRNTYETKIGKFKKAIELHIESFRELPERLKQLEHAKNKKVVMYCTGGVRCEKSSAFLKEKGFKHVYQLEGGILNYANRVGSDHYDGACFVFDDRLNDEVDDAPIAKCITCNVLSSRVDDCHNLLCDKLMVQCSDCAKNMTRTCSNECKNAPHHRPRPEKSKKVIGVVEKYYAKKGVALVRLSENLSAGEVILIKGKTTKSEELVRELRVHGGSLVTFPVSSVVRKNDRVLLEC